MMMKQMVPSGAIASGARVVFASEVADAACVYAWHEVPYLPTLPYFEHYKAVSSRSR